MEELERISISVEAASPGTPFDLYYSDPGSSNENASLEPDQGTQVAPLDADLEKSDSTQNEWSDSSSISGSQNVVAVEDETQSPPEEQKLEPQPAAALDEDSYTDRQRFAAKTLSCLHDKDIGNVEDFTKTLDFIQKLEHLLIGDKWKSNPEVMIPFDEVYAYLAFAEIRGGHLIPMLDLDDPVSSFDSIKATEQARVEAVLTKRELAVLRDDPQLIRTYMRAKCLLRLCTDEKAANSLLHSVIFFELGDVATNELYANYKYGEQLKIGKEWQSLQHLRALISEKQNTDLVAELLVKLHRNNLGNLVNIYTVQTSKMAVQACLGYVSWSEQQHIVTKSSQFYGKLGLEPSKGSEEKFFSPNQRLIGKFGKNRRSMFVCSMIWLHLSQILSVSIPMLDFGTWPRRPKNKPVDSSRLASILSLSTEKKRSFLITNMLFGQVQVTKKTFLTVVHRCLAAPLSFEALLELYGILDFWQNDCSSSSMERHIYSIIHQSVCEHADGILKPTLTLAITKRDERLQSDEIMQQLKDAQGLDRTGYLAQQICVLIILMPEQVLDLLFENEENKFLSEELQRWEIFANVHAHAILPAINDGEVSEEPDP